MSGPVFTKLHAALELMNNRHELRELRGSADTNSVMELLVEMSRVPLYVLDWDLSMKLEFKTLAKSANAIHDAGRMHLPFPRLTFELWGRWAPVGKPKDVQQRLFVMVDEKGPGAFDCSVLEWRTNGEEEAVSTIFRLGLDWIATPIPGAKIYPPLKPGETDADLAGFAASWDDEAPIINEDLANRLIHEIGMGMLMGVMMVNIAGVEREKVTPKASFNRARERSGKPRIPDHTVVRIGHVYNSSGQRVAYDRGDSGRQPMRVHMRAAHTRRQQHGPAFLDTDEGRQYRGLSSTTETHHVVLIDAVLVNYRDGTDLERPLPKVVKF